MLVGPTLALERITTGSPMHQPQSNADVKDQVRQTIIDANQAAREAPLTARDARDARHGIRAAPVLAGPVPGGPGIIIQNPYGYRNSGMPPEIAEISIAFFVMCAVIIIGWPLARAFARRMDRRSETTAAANPGVTAHLQRIEQAVDAMSIEVERISESQRFMAKLQSAGTADRLSAPVDR